MTRNLADFMWTMLLRIVVTLIVGRVLAQSIAGSFHRLYLVINRFDGFLR